ncbi:MAG: hypothetical protein M5U26_22900 [Planctomycetota bacterium]|nr:hypothetical protein [Planctomycetota bacterium]
MPMLAFEFGALERLWHDLLALPWWRFAALTMGLKLALAILALCVALTALAAASHVLARLFARPSSESEPASGEARPRKGWGLKAAVLLILAILPMGLTAAGAVYLVMGKANWRRDALALFVGSLSFALPLGWLASPWFPYPEWARSEYVVLLPALGFSMLQLWALVKVLREYWGEPDERVPLFPPIVWWAQALLLGLSSYGVLARG